MEAGHEDRVLNRIQKLIKHMLQCSFAHMDDCEMETSGYECRVIRIYIEINFSIYPVSAIFRLFCHLYLVFAFPLVNSVHVSLVK